jgi:hypothetical protein
MFVKPYISIARQGKEIGEGGGSIAGNFPETQQTQREMKNLKKIFQAATLALGLAFSADIEAQTIPTNFFGQNAWMPDSIGSVNYGGKLHQNWSKVKDSKTTLIRFGGIGVDNNKPTNYQYIKMIDSIRANGMEPIIQVPFHKYAYTAQQAADIVHYINVTKGKNIQYWVIGNEPDLDYAYTSASQVAAYFKPFASAMKAVDPSIKIIGPECAWYNSSIINGLTTPGGPDDITGKDAAGRYYVDIISFHYYGFNGSQSRNDVVTKLNSTGGLNDNLALLNARIATCNTAHNRSGAAALKTAVTEANVGYRNAETDNLNGNGTNSFIGAQFIAEMFSVGLKNGVNFMNVWSVVEGNSQALNIGYLDRTSGAKKPAYYHYQMMAANFKGNFVNGSTNNSNVKAFASQTSQYTTVMILNQDLSNNFNYTVRLNNTAIGGNSALKVNVNANINVEYNGVMQGQSTLLLVFNASGALVKKIEYTLLNHAISNLAPTETTYNGGVVNNNVTTSVDENGNDIQSMKGFVMNVYPNPAKSKFTIELDRNNALDIDFEVELFDLMGRLIFKQTSIFAERVQTVDLTGRDIAEAVYIVRVREKGDKENVRSQKVVIFK